MKFTRSQMRYLMAIYRLSEMGVGVRSSDVVEFLGFARPSVSRMLGILSELGLLEKDRFGKISFTQAGRATVEAMWLKVEHLTSQLEKALALTSEAAENCALLLLTELPQHFQVTDNVMNNLLENA